MRCVPIEVRRQRFLAKCLKAHGLRYDYSSTVFFRSSDKVVIVCRKHGEFSQIAQGHAAGQGCPKCGKFGAPVNTGDFIARMEAQRPGAFTFDRCVYIEHKKKVTVTCVVHGDFDALPTNLLAGRGCPECNFDKRKAHGLNTFLTRSIARHKGVFDYSKVVYRGAHTLVHIGCPIHGDFWQTPANHYQGSRCSDCAYAARAISHGEREVEEWLVSRGIEFSREKTFDGLVNPKTGFRLRFDFFLIKEGVLVEFDGPHHFEPVRGDYENLARVQARDAIKNAFAKRMNIPLIRIHCRSQIDANLSRHLTVSPSG